MDMILFGRLFEPVETLADQFAFMVELAIHPQLITGLTITQFGRTLPPVIGQRWALRLTQARLIPATHLQRRFTTNIAIRRQGARLLRRLLHPAHRLGIIRLGRQTLGQFILGFAMTLLGCLR